MRAARETATLKTGTSARTEFRRSERKHIDGKPEILRGGGGLGKASCIGGATFNHRQKSTTPLNAVW
ncbi:hypothetical protein PUN28_014205 [Cardiocondyla obscurior]|uniref:Uncharacterized protein n=1 Tax=Cardiocondyla obscurior TaxID=286306 RepID=A0AAW2F2U1_9HYME